MGLGAPDGAWGPHEAGDPANGPGRDPIPFGYDLVAFRVTPSAVRDGDPAPAAQALGRLLRDRDTVTAYVGRVSFLLESEVRDTREIHAIPELRAYFRALNAEFPFWIHFLPVGMPIADLWHCLSAA